MVRKEMHPLDLFKFCPKCGAPAFVENCEKSKRCTACGFVYYFNVSSATVAFILNERGELLVWRRATLFNMTIFLSYISLEMMSLVNPGEFCPIPYELITTLIFIIPFAKF